MERMIAEIIAATQGNARQINAAGRKNPTPFP
jgi:hypothetical protein